MLFVAALTTLVAAASPPAQAQISDLFPESAGAPVLDMDPSVPFNAKKTPLQEADAALLTEAGYSLTDIGALIAPGGGVAVGAGEVFYILEDLRSRKRLGAMLQIRLIQNQIDPDEPLPPAGREEIRRISRENWSLFSARTRSQLRENFSLRELDEMDRMIPKEAAMRPPGDFAFPVASLPEQVPIPIDQPLKTLAGTVMPLGMSAVPGAPRRAGPTGLPPLKPRESPTAAGRRTPPVPAASGFTEGGAVFKAEPAPPPPVASAAPGVALTNPFLPSAPTGPRAWEAPPRQAQVAAAPVPQQAPAPVRPPPPLAAPPLPSPPAPPVFIDYPDFNPEAFEAFLADAPYGRGVKPLLQLIAAHAEPDERRAALGVLVRTVPHIVIDSVKAGTRARSRVTRMPDPDRIQIALNDGPVLEKAGGLFSKRAVLLPDAPEAYAEAGAAKPSRLSFNRTSASESEAEGEWGRVRAYADGSERLKRSQASMAGALLHALVVLDASRRGSTDDFHIELAASAAEFALYRGIEKGTGREPVLDRDLAARWSDWENRPEDFVDLQFQASLRPGPRPELLGAPARPRPAAAADEAVMTTYTPPSRTFSVSIPGDWTAFEHRTPRGTSVHIVSPDPAETVLPPAYHVHYIETGRPGFQPGNKTLKAERRKDKLTDRHSTSPVSWRIAAKPGRIFEVKETRMLPPGGLPAEAVSIHHFYAMVPTLTEDFFMIKLTTTEESYLKYRAEFKRFLKSFRIIGY